MRETPGPRRLTITTRHHGERVTIEVADTGPGVAPELRAKIFEPFFTTKPPGQGTGLGLSLCRGIVDRHLGTIGILDTPGGGATFRIELPVGTPVEPPEPAASPEGTPATTHTILVVDDEPAVAELLAEFLTLDGHLVDTATSAAEAIDKIEAGDYDLVFCDLRMPDMDGARLYQEIERNRPLLARHWVFLTGDALGVDTAAFLAKTAVPTVTKPLGPDDLRRAVARLAARHQEAANSRHAA